MSNTQISNADQVESATGTINRWMIGLLVLTVAALSFYSYQVTVDRNELARQMSMAEIEADAKDGLPDDIEIVVYFIEKIREHLQNYPSDEGQIVNLLVNEVSFNKNRPVIKLCSNQLSKMKLPRK